MKTSAKRLAYIRRWCERNRERVRAYKKKWAQANRERRKAYRTANKNRIAEYHQKWRAAHRAERATYDREYFLSHRSRITKYKLAWGRASARARRAFFLNGRSCKDCGSTTRLEFHHRNPATKLFNVAEWSRPLTAIRAEIKKCDVLCRNCHMRRHNEGRRKAA